MDIFTVTTLKLPIDEIESAIKIAKSAKQQLAAIDEQANKLPTLEETRKLKGFEGVTARTEQLAAFDAQKKQITITAQAKIRALHEQAVTAINAQTTPNGADIVGDNAGDFALIEHGLVATADQLCRLLKKHDNVAFRMAAQRYAADPSRNWEGFMFFDKEDAVREYTEQIFERLLFACTNTYGPAYMQYVEMPTEYLRIARAYGIESEFLESGGGRLNDIIAA